MKLTTLHDGLAVFPRIKTQTEIAGWLSSFQEVINDSAGNANLLFTAQIWTPGGSGEPKIERKVGMETLYQFPILDMEMSWNNEGAKTEVWCTLETKPGPQVPQCRERSHSRLPQSNHNRCVLPLNAQS
jgi:hypothetical protein